MCHLPCWLGVLSWHCRVGTTLAFATLIQLLRNGNLNLCLAIAFPSSLVSCTTPGISSIHLDLWTIYALKQGTTQGSTQTGEVNSTVATTGLEGCPEVQKYCHTITLTLILNSTVVTGHQVTPDLWTSHEPAISNMSCS